ncbi:T9SS sorting signal type C domain-containing protein [Flavobacterium sp. AS60]|uniref:T9SS sorting signal type C domain-containing protein n=1 Tax=Flavobacterium anseongense TaxID=2910677 RepID=UPI001F380D3E|nr:T9SS sorting signal type C domain-containing protein [Flavobacterium sp. AS60]MCF6129343.1 T9SS sorting signal type C domain-containing protein [Flavobacterium sp. AS60]
MKLKILFIALFVSAFSWGQTNLAAGGTFTENFNGLGASSTATLPTNWKAQKTTNVRDAALTYSTAVTAVELAGGNSMSTTAGNGIYRYNANNVTTESAVGGLSSSSASKTVAFMSYFNNNAATAISSFTISYDVEKYRKGSNAAGFTVDLLYSTDGTTWTVCGGTLTTSIAADADNTGYTTAPGTTTAVTGTYTPAASLALNDKFYFAWRYSVTSGTTTSNAQALGFDNVSITANSSTPPAVTIADNGTQIAAANVAQGTTNHILSTFQTTVANSNATLTAASFATSGTYQASDIVASGLKLWYNTANDFATATQLGSGFTATATGTGETITFSSLSQSVTVGTRYFWVTASIDAAATTGRTISLNAIATTNLTFSSGTKSGSATAGGTQTITLTAPAVPGSITKGCTTNTTQVLNWSAPATGTYDGYLLVVRQGGVPNAVTTIYVPSQTTNLDYSLAPTYNATTSRVLYKTTAAATVSVTVTGLTAGLSYTFAVYAYKNNGASTLYSATATTTTQTIGLPNVTSATATAGNTSASLTWANPTAACFDQVLVVVTAASGITFAPTGSTGTAYTANTVFAAFNQAVYYSSGNTVSITGLTNGTTYYLEIFVRNGSEWSSGVEVSVTPTNVNPTVLKTGELILIAYDNAYGSANDAIRLLTFVDINPGTKFLWTNGTYETGGLPASNVRTDKWFECVTPSPTGNIPYLEFTYNGSSVIPAASTFCIETVSGTGTTSTVTAVSPSGTVFPNTSFTIVCKSADGSTGLGHGIVNVSTSQPDSMFLLQGSFVYDAAGSTFVGTVLSGVQDGGLWYDLSDDLSAVSGDNLRRSRKHPDLLCASIQANSSPASYEVSYDVSVTPGNTTGTKPYLLGQILSYSTNWISSFGSCPATSPFVINASDAFNRWIGALSTNWFDCNNWAQLTVPDELTDVVLFSSAARDAVIDYTAAYSDQFSDVAKCKNLTISGRKVQLEASASNKLEVYGDLLINTTGVLDMDDSNSGTADGNLYLYKNFTNSLTTASFLEGNGTVSFVGSSPQIINSNVHTNPEDFYNVILDNDFNTTISNNLIATGNLEVKVNKYVTIGSAAYPDDYIRVHNKLTSNGDVTIENGGQLIQVNDTDTNDGDYSGTKFTVKRNYTARDIDYVYWSAPTKLFAVANIPNGYRYEWNPVYSNLNGTTGTWRTPSTTNMTAGKGYIARTFNGSSTLVTNSFSFTGQPNNGAITIPISRGNYYGDGITTGLDYTVPTTPTPATVTRWDDNWNLVGNPYPSAINSLTFLSAANNPDIEGFVYLWSHNTAPSTATIDPFYNDFYSNYTTADYIVYNGSGTISGPSGFNGKIASGQGFFVLMKDGAAGSSVVNFNNSMRRNTSTNASYSNTQFYKNATVENTVVGEEEKSRIWLDIISPQNTVKRTLVAYVESATNQKDRLYDAVTKPNSLDIYSYVDNDLLQAYCIQGRAMPFVDSDTVTLGIKVSSAGNYKIAIAAVDGLFQEGQPIYLEDRELNIIHDLRAAPYTFAANAGAFNNRFVLRYTNAALGNPDFGTIDNNVIVASNHGEMSIKSYIENIKEVTVYDVLGRQLYFAKAINNTSFATSNISMSHQTLIVKIKLENGVTISRKIIL